MYDAKGRKDKESQLAHHLPMVQKLAHQLRSKLPANVEVDDLIQAGMMGLLDALDRYEPTQAAQFETYAVQRIRGAMLDELRSMDWLPRSVRQNMRKIEQAMTQLQQNLQRPPLEAEIAEKLDMPLKTYQQVLSESMGHQLIYFEDFHQADPDGDHFLDRHFSDKQSDPLQNLQDSGLRQAIVQAIERLPEREKLLMALYYEQELNLKEIGAVLGITESRVSQLHSQSIGRIRAQLRSGKWTSAASSV